MFPGEALRNMGGAALPVTRSGQQIWLRTRLAAPHFAPSTLCAFKTLQSARLRTSKLALPNRLCIPFKISRIAGDAVLLLALRNGTCPGKPAEDCANYRS